MRLALTAGTFQRGIDHHYMVFSQQSGAISIGQRPHAQALLDLGLTHGLPQLARVAKFTLAWACAAAQSAGARGNARRHWRFSEKWIFASSIPLFGTLLAEAEAAAGEVELLWHRWRSNSRRSGRRANAGSTAELHRVRGEILLKRDPTNTAPAEEAFLTAIAVAQLAEGEELRVARGAFAGEALSIDRPRR